MFWTPFLRVTTELGQLVQLPCIFSLTTPSSKPMYKMSPPSSWKTNKHNLKRREILLWSTQVILFFMFGRKIICSGLVKIDLRVPSLFSSPATVDQNQGLVRDVIALLRNCIFGITWSMFGYFGRFFGQMVIEVHTWIWTKNWIQIGPGKVCPIRLRFIE